MRGLARRFWRKTCGKLLLAARNLKHVELIEVAQINPLSLLDHERVLMTVGAVKLLEERFQ